ncbi:MAG: acylphosphatase [Crocinitomicaceae bacterium]|nr:acylphosphatase [Crocinitomicaceae bacterium]|tara:strand:+ start:440 stop:712 length:273 start_codon:yes stop_codon:yes gene_type:complete
MKHINISVKGKVQGVFFRKNTQEKALSLGISGFVQNENDGSVYIEAEGFDEDLEEFVEWCHEGPDKAEVESVKVWKGQFQNYEDFEIAYR